MESPKPSCSTSDENVPAKQHPTRLTPDKVMEILGQQGVKTKRLPTAYDNYRKSVRGRRGEHGQFLGTETGFSCLSQDDRDRFKPTLDQLHEAEEILRLEDLKSSLHSIMEELETRYGVSAFSIASGPLQSKESVYFASPSAQPFVEYDYNQMRTVIQDDHNMFYRWNLFLHSRDSFFPGDENGPLPTRPGPSAGSEVRGTPDAVMRKVVRRLVEDVTGQLTGRTFSEKTIEQFLFEHGFSLEFGADWDFTRLQRAYETRSHPSCREIINAVEDGNIRVVRSE
ncbi:hypothetical protein POJ06DRAFT_258454 [Lipomyces tetrasporus]|uniref:Uncharacterized protein n=1 Tax=Lipomyces tetrasporus TaxID=54092 RepID=A0AAD7QSM2_9ASCO|nr:uncharacterized protein POJ06DRAFT_258454 [Lipomyces tetrasporus]KAJ8098972.1 hypothetical protein POJ06DRAFT_258454 [Lipomyces tetrasporus]